MIECREQLDLAQKTALQVRVAGQIGQQDFHGLDALGDGVAHLIDFSHASGAEHADYFIVAKFVADFESHDGLPAARSENGSDGICANRRYSLLTWSPTLGVPDPLKVPTAKDSSTSVIVKSPSLFTTLRRTLPVAGSLMSLTFLDKARWSPTLTPALLPTLMVMLFAETSATRPSTSTTRVGRRCAFWSS